MLKHISTLLVQFRNLLRIVALISILFSLIQISQAEDDTVRLKTIGEAYQKNRESFPHLKCHFVLSCGYSKGIEESLLHGPTRGTVSVNGVWIVDGEKERYELNQDKAQESQRFGVTQLDQKNVRKIGPDTYMIMGPTIVPSKFLRHKGVALCINFDSLEGVISSPKVAAPPEVKTPFDMAGSFGSTGKLTPGYIIKNWLGRKKGYTFSYEGAALVDGRRLVRMEVSGVANKESKRPLPLRFTFLLDHERGMLPIQMWTSLGDRVYEKAFTTDVLKCSNGRWFPSRIVRMSFLGPDPDVPSFTWELKVDQLDVDHTPSDEEFSISLPKSTGIHNGNPKSLIRLQKSNAIGLDDLPKLADKTARQAVKKMNPTTKGTRF